MRFIQGSFFAPLSSMHANTLRVDRHIPLDYDAHIDREQRRTMYECINVCIWACESRYVSLSFPFSAFHFNELYF